MRPTRRADSPETLITVTDKILIDGFAELEQAVMDDPTMRAKMAYVARLVQSEPDYAKNLTTESLIAFAELYPDYDIPISTVDGKKALRFDASPSTGTRFHGYSPTITFTVT